MQRLKALSIIEILIALIVFGTGILVILKILWANILFVDRVWLRAQATFLAQENLELLFTHRMANYKLGNQWDCVDVDCNNVIWKDGARYVNFYLNNDWYSIEISNTSWDLEKFQMSLIDGLWTKGAQQVKWSVFWRYLDFSPFWSQADGKYLPMEEIKSVISVAWWQKWAYSGSIELQTFISDWR